MTIWIHLEPISINLDLVRLPINVLTKIKIAEQSPKYSIIVVYKSNCIIPFLYE